MLRAKCPGPPIHPISKMPVSKMPISTMPWSSNSSHKWSSDTSHKLRHKWSSNTSHKLRQLARELSWVNSDCCSIIDNKHARCCLLTNIAALHPEDPHACNANLHVKGI